MLVTSFGLGAVFITDVATFSVGVVSLLIASIPQPQPTQEEHVSFLDDLRYGMRYIWQRPPFIILISLLSLFMFFQGIAYALTGPLVLSFADAQALGWSYMGFGLGALVGGGLLGVWGGPKRRMNGIIAGLFTVSVGCFITSLRPNALLIALGLLIFGLGFIFMIGLNRVIYQVKAAPEVLGRIFSLRVMLGVSMQSVGILVAGPLVMRVFQPFLSGESALAGQLGQIVGIDEGRGAALMYLILAGVSWLIGCLALVPKVRKLEDDLPDYVNTD
ncbi:MAG: MFS transporter [Deinococcota bacterium]